MDCMSGCALRDRYWQVGDSSEQNGCFKMALTSTNANFFNAKSCLAGVEFAINKEDITYIVSHAWADSIARGVHNKSAMADCDGIHSTITACSILKLLQHNMLKEDLWVVVVMFCADQVVATSALLLVLRPCWIHNSHLIVHPATELQLVMSLKMAPRSSGGWLIWMSTMSCMTPFQWCWCLQPNLYNANSRISFSWSPAGKNEKGV